MSSVILNNLDLAAVLAGGFYAGTSLYITIGDVPALRAFGVDEHWRFFPHMFARAAVSQSVFTAIAGVASIVHGTRIISSSSDRNLWLASGSIFIAMIPYTLFGLQPINNIILNDNKRITSGDESQVNTNKRTELLDKWTLLHLGRTVGSVVAFGAMVYGLSRHSSLVSRW